MGLPDFRASATVQGRDETVLDPDSLRLVKQTLEFEYGLSRRQPDGGPAPFDVRENHEFSVRPIEDTQPRGSRVGERRAHLSKEAVAVWCSPTAFAMCRCLTGPLA